MSNRLDELRIIDPVLTSIANSYNNSNFVGTKLFPEVFVSKEKGKIPSFGFENFIVKDDVRAIRAKSNRIPPTDFTMIEFELMEHDEEMALDQRELDEAESTLKYETRITKELKDVIDVGKEKAISDLVQSTGTMTQNIDLSDAWATAATGTPISDINTGREAIRSATGRYPNVMVISADALALALACDQVTGVIAYSGFNIPTVNLLAKMVDIDEAYVGLSQYSSDGSTLTNLWTDTCILAYVDKTDKSSRDIYSPSFAYTFQKSGNPEIDTYRENGGKIKVIRNTDIYIPKVVGAGAGYLIKNAGA